MLSACGTYIPSQRDWPNGSVTNVENMNAVLAHSIICELSYAVTLTVLNDVETAPHRRSRSTHADFLANWGVEVATDLTVLEKSAINPAAIWTPNAIFSLAGGFAAGAEASNDNQYNVFYPLSALYKPNFFHTGSDDRPCRDPNGNKEGSPLVDIDLQILPLLETRVLLVNLNFADAPGKVTVEGEKNVLTQTVSIKETLSGDVTPKWTFTNVTVNSQSPFLNAERDRTHQIVFTFGPL